MATVVITAENFEQEVIQAAGTVLLDFWAPWCGYCKMIDPVVEAVEADWEKSGKDLTVGRINIDEEIELADKFGVSTIPTLMVYKNGEKKGTSIGFKQKAAIEELLAAAE
jgi:thioredoxin 1